MATPLSAPVSYVIDGTSWPKFDVPDAIRALIEKFFTLMDDSGPGVGDKLADEVFTSDGVLVASAGTTRGSSEIRKCRDNAWSVIKKRRHTVRTVYIHDPECSDLMLIGDAEMGLADARSVNMQFTARIITGGDASSAPRIKMYQVWADTAAFAKALAGP
ncbi:hypothetical protein NX059_003621 [Plenodomus lindquistii]|nr:hypothetical protein NX059_003621 [Plenodomus lindquistii]